MLTIAIMAVTVYLASRKPVRVAERISVMEALGYQTSKTVYTGKKKRTGKNIIYRLAWQQLFMCGNAGGKPEQTDSGTAVYECRYGTDQ